MIATLTLNPALDMTSGTQAIHADDKLRCSAPQFDPGGGGINVARAITELGGATTAIFPYGGANGERLLKLVEGHGVATMAVAIAGETRESLTVDEVSTGRQFRFVFPGPIISDPEQEACTDVLQRLKPRPAWVVASGSLPPGMDATFFRALAAGCRELDAKLVVDNANLTLEAIEHCEIELLKPNLRELGLMAGRVIEDDQALVTAARDIIGRQCAKALVVSKGADGAFLVTRDSARAFPALPVTPQSAVGAGDCMVAGIVMALSRGLSLDDAVEFGMATGAAALLTPRTELLHRADVEMLLGSRAQLFLGR